MKVIRVPLGKKQLDPLPVGDRAFLLLLGHAANEVNILRKLLLYSISVDRSVPLERDANWGQQLMILKLLSMKLWGIWEKFPDDYKKYRGRGGRWRQLDRTGAGELRSIQSYFKNSKNSIKQLRHKFGAHYDPTQINRGYSHLLADDTSRSLYIGRMDDHFYIEVADYVTSLAMGSVGDDPPTNERLATIITDVLETSTKFLRVARSIVVAIYKHYIQGQEIEGDEEESEVEIHEVAGTYFLINMERKKAKGATTRAPSSTVRYLAHKRT